MPVICTPGCHVLDVSLNVLLLLKGNSYQIVLSKTSLPGIEVPIGKLLRTILGRLRGEAL